MLIISNIYAEAVQEQKKEEEKKNVHTWQFNQIQNDADSPIRRHRDDLDPPPLSQPDATQELSL